MDHHDRVGSEDLAGAAGLLETVGHVVGGVFRDDRIDGEKIAFEKGAAPGDKTVAVLVPRNLRGADVIEKLKVREIPFVEMLGSTASTRAATGRLDDVISALADLLKRNKIRISYDVVVDRIRFDEMGRQGGFGRADRPDVQVVNSRDT